MKLDLALAEGSLTDAMAAGARARECGFGRVWTTESTSDPFLQAYAALDRGAPSIGTAIAVAFARTPMAMAYPAWDLAAASGGRFTLGLGSQVKAHIERRFGMPWSEPVKRMRDYVAALRAIWSAWRTGDPLHYEGPFYRHTLMTPVFTPAPHEYPVPIGIASVGPLMTRLAGEVADALIVHPFNTVEYFDRVTSPALEQGLRAAGRTRAEVEVFGAVFLVMGDTEEKLAIRSDEARTRLAFYGSTPAYQPVLDAIGRADLQPELNALARRGDWSAMGRLIDDDTLGKLAIVGRPEEIPDLLRGRWGSRLDRAAAYGGWPPLADDRLAGIVRAVDGG